MENPFFRESSLPYDAPEFDKISVEHYLPAFKEGIRQAKAEIDAIVDNPLVPTFENTIEAIEYSGRMLDRVSSIFWNLNEADTSDRMQEIAEEVSPMLTEYSMYVSLNAGLFARVKYVWERRGDLQLEPDRRMLLEDTYKSFVRGGANLPREEKALLGKYSEELSLLSLEFQKNVLASSNAFVMTLTDRADLASLPDYVLSAAEQASRERGLEGWTFTLDAPSYTSFMRFSPNRSLRRRMYLAYNTRAMEGETDNTGVVAKIVDLRAKIAALLGYWTYADYALEERMAKNEGVVLRFLDELLAPSLPYARADVEKVLEYAREHGFEDTELQPWDFSFWSERYKEAEFALNEEELKPYFRIESCIRAVFSLASRLYDISFEKRDDLPVYHEDVQVFDVKDADGSHLALFYADFFPRQSKRSGAWMTEFRGQCIYGGVEERPFISIVTNFTKPTPSAPSLLTHDEFTTLLHEFGHALHGMLAKGRYTSHTGTNVVRDFVELPSQIMENWAFEPEYLHTFARHYLSGEAIPDDLIRKIVSAKNYLAGYFQVRQLQFGILDMAWHTLTAAQTIAGEWSSDKAVAGAGTSDKTDSDAGTPDKTDGQAAAVHDRVVEFEKKTLARCAVLPDAAGCAISPSFGHIFSGGYSAGYYSYKWAEVLEADAFSLFEEKGVFDKGVAASFRKNILEKGGGEDAVVLYRNFRGHDPQPEALLVKLGLTAKP